MFFVFLVPAVPPEVAPVASYMRYIRDATQFVQIPFDMEEPPEQPHTHATDYSPNVVTMEVPIASAAFTSILVDPNSQLLGIRKPIVLERSFSIGPPTRQVFSDQHRTHTGRGGR